MTGAIISPKTVCVRPGHAPHPSHHTSGLSGRLLGIRGKVPAYHSRSRLDRKKG
jgi:hypothetical protein